MLEPLRKEAAAVLVVIRIGEKSDGLFRAPSSKGNHSACTFRPRSLRSGQLMRQLL